MVSQTDITVYLTLERKCSLIPMTHCPVVSLVRVLLSSQCKQDITIVEKMEMPFHYVHASPALITATAGTSGS